LQPLQLTSYASWLHHEGWLGLESGSGLQAEYMGRIEDPPATAPWAPLAG